MSDLFPSELTLDTFSRLEWDLITEAITLAIAREARRIENPTNEHELRAANARFDLFNGLALKIQDVTR